MPLEEAVKCRCGLRMVPQRGGFMCENCDSVQPQEPFSLARAKTRYDIRYDMYWLQVMNTEYQDNTRNQPNEGEERKEK